MITRILKINAALEGFFVNSAAREQLNWPASYIRLHTLGLDLS